jgi:hypothetical protein
MSPVVAAVLTSGLVLAGCTSQSSPAPASPTPVVTQTLTSPPPSVATTPISTGPVTAKSGSCPFISLSAAMNVIGQRLARSTELRSGGATIGCRFYAIQGSALHTSENLPGPNQPDIEITTARYASADAAHNAVVTTAEAGTEFAQVSITGTYAAIYRTRFDPTDGSRDWACVFSIGTRLVVIKTADDNESASVVGIAKLVARKILG